MAEMIYGFVVSDQPVEYYLQFAKNNGLAHLEIDLYKDHSLLESWLPKRIDNLRRKSQEFGVRLSIHPPYTLNLGDKIKTVAKAQVELLKKSIELARKLDAQFVTTYIGSVNNQKGLAAARKQALGHAIDNLEEVLEYCEKNKMKLALENTNLMPKDSELFYLGDNLKDFELVFSKLKSPLLNFCLDLGHAHVNEGISKYIDKFGAKIINVHFHDNNGKTDDHLNLGEGNIKWKQVMKSFSKIGFSGPFLSETKDSPAQSKRKLLEYLV
jgi:sugar phosphate isomerase/epimerase